MCFGSFDPLTVMVLLEVMKSNALDTQRTHRKHVERPSLIAAAWKRLLRWWRRPITPLQQARPEAPAS